MDTFRSHSFITNIQATNNIKIKTQGLNILSQYLKNQSPTEKGLQYLPWELQLYQDLRKVTSHQSSELLFFKWQRSEFNSRSLALAGLCSIKIFFSMFLLKSSLSIYIVPQQRQPAALLLGSSLLSQEKVTAASRTWLCTSQAPSLVHNPDWGRGSRLHSTRQSQANRHWSAARCRKASPVGNQARQQQVGFGMCCGQSSHRIGDRV